eukprot:104322-Rhodomonas_salina.3
MDEARGQWEGERTCHITEEKGHVTKGPKIRRETEQRYVTCLQKGARQMSLFLTFHLGLRDIEKLPVDQFLLECQRYLERVLVAHLRMGGVSYAGTEGVKNRDDEEDSAEEKKSHRA